MGKLGFNCAFPENDLIEGNMNFKKMNIRQNMWESEVNGKRRPGQGGKTARDEQKKVCQIII